jgi:flagellar basal body-associated protein FliL
MKYKQPFSTLLIVAITVTIVAVVPVSLWFISRNASVKQKLQPE